MNSTLSLVVTLVALFANVFLFLTGGMGTEDVAWGYDVYQEALKQGLGQKLSLWEKPHWA